MPRRSKQSKHDEAVEAVALLVVVLILAWVFRGQIISWFARTLSTLVSAFIGFVVLVAFPFVVGVVIAKYLLSSEIIETSGRMWIAILLCVVGLYLLSNVVIGHGVNAFLTMAVIGILALFCYDILTD